MYSCQLELNSYDYVNTCHVAPGYVHVLSGQAVCYPLDMHIIIIIIIIWHYNPLWVFAYSAKSLDFLLSLVISFQFLTFSFFISSITSSCHRCPDLLTGLVPMGFQSISFLVGLASLNMPQPFDSLCLDESHHICTFY